MHALLIRLFDLSTTDTKCKAYAGVFKRKRTVSFRLCFNACFGKSVDVAGREAVDQGGILARVSGHCEGV
jgi:hypothetical protein